MSLPKPYYEEPGITIYNSDCRDIIPHLEPVDLVLTDPPYGIGESNEKNLSRGKLANPTDYGHYDWDKKPIDKYALEKCICKGEKAIVFGGNFFELPPSSCWLVWDKINTRDFADGELAWTNFKSAVRIFRFMWNGMLKAGEMRGIKRVHPTEKPPELMRWCIAQAGEPQTILDPFMGSGTTLRAAKDLGRKAIGIEISEDYCKIAIQRLRQETFSFPQTPTVPKNEENRGLF